MNIRGLCVCSFGLRTIAVLMSLFPSLGISSFRTAVCCDGENEYTTPAPRCQPLFAFFLDFFAFFLCSGMVEGGFYMDNAKVPALPCTHQPFERLGDQMAALTDSGSGPGMTDFGFYKIPDCSSERLICLSSVLSRPLGRSLHGA